MRDYFLVVALLPIAASLPEYCPQHSVYGSEPEDDCEEASDPNRLPKSGLEKWFTKEMFEDLFPKANLGHGPHPCLPYSYEAFTIAARYFPEFGNEAPTKPGASRAEVQKRDVAAFLAHVIQETGEQDLGLYNSSLSTDEASECFYRGGLYNWFERGPNSSFLVPAFPGYNTVDGKRCTDEGAYCNRNPVMQYWFPCNDEEEHHANKTFHRGCYFGRGPLQLSWNYNYGAFEHFLRTRKINVNLVENPNLIMTKLDPPLAMLASLWFYMTPQPPKPSMHQIIVGDWRASTKNRRAGYAGSVFGPTSLIINNECGGEDADTPGGPGENRRIKAFKWFSNYFEVDPGANRTLSCKGMIEPFESNEHLYSYQPDWANMWRSRPCDCVPAPYGGPLPYYDPKFYPARFVRENDRSRLRCVFSLYDEPSLFRLDDGNSPCLKHRPKIKLTKTGF
ncbi:hypothetical protein PRIPAC_71761 [Pristionchus pacificus]|uniref:Glycoside hydrolase n=1 Tax=Pristionchus pacificus TaxID=54126 RepID=A0A2A6BRT7_PRIPA|nr:hypothetical protein PRIPAC_71761 [Pristionchus pacificus]|eukprot:PDM68513.1 glycoside hydrolase [Pristionchus pacificus]